MALRVNTDNFQTEVLESDVPVIVEFYSDSCIPCKKLSPILGDIEDEYENQVKVVKINVNFDSELSELYKVMASPTILFFCKGEELKRLRGDIAKEELTDILKTLF